MSRYTPSILTPTVRQKVILLAFYVDGFGIE